MNLWMGMYLVFIGRFFSNIAHGNYWKASQATLLEVSSFEPFSGSPRIAVDHRRRARTHSRPSRRDALYNDIFRGLGRLRRSLHRCAASCLEVSFTCIRM